MLNILLCCGGGFSSSAIATRMQKEIETKGLANQYHIEFYPFAIIASPGRGNQFMGNYSETPKIENFDVVILCPHLKIEVQRFLKSEGDHGKPFYILPPKMYGGMVLEEIIADCEDVVEMYHNGASNPVHFPGEDNVLRIQRSKAYRNSRK